MLPKYFSFFRQELDFPFRMRRSADKLTEKISNDFAKAKENESAVYLKAETVGVVVSKTTGGDHIVFTVSGDANDLKETNLENKDQPILISVGRVCLPAIIMVGRQLVIVVVVVVFFHALSC
jgi:hypothetical protein